MLLVSYQVRIQGQYTLPSIQCLLHYNKAFLAGPIRLTSLRHGIFFLQILLFLLLSSYYQKSSKYGFNLKTLCCNNTEQNKIAVSIILNKHTLLSHSVISTLKDCHRIAPKLRKFFHGIRRSTINRTLK
jgi:hypothetical protein